jgi:predicted ferric reductase
MFQKGKMMQEITFPLLLATATFGLRAEDLFLLFGTLLWIAMLADCLAFNKSLPWKQKLLWMLVLIFIAPIGTILYFLIAFMGRFLVQKEPPIPTKEMHKETYSGYEQGYQQEQQPVYQPSQQAYLTTENNMQESSSFPLYEQPQASYPEKNE